MANSKLLRIATSLSVALWFWNGHLSLANDAPAGMHRTCVDSAKQPLKGVRVRVLQATGEPRPRQFDSSDVFVPNLKVTQEVITDAAGRYVLNDEGLKNVDPATPFQQPIFVFDVPGWLPIAQPLSWLSTQTLTESKETATVRFIDSDKNPVANVIARCVSGRLTAGTLDPGPEVGIRLVADRQGLMQVPLGTEGTSAWVQAPGYLPFAFRLVSSKPGNRHEFGFDIYQASAEPVDVPMAPSGEATGRVVDTAGLPVPGAIVVGLVRPVQQGIGPRRQIDLRCLETVADEQGRFRLPGLPRDWVELVVFDQTRSAGAQALVTGIPWQTGDIVVKPMREVHGLIWNRGKNTKLQPQDEIRVAFRSAQFGTRWSAVVDRQGEFTIPVPASVEGAPQLLPHPTLAQVGLGPPPGANLPGSLVIVRVQEKSAAIPDDELQAHLNVFPRDYALAEGQSIRHVAAPFTPSRQALWQFLRQRPKTTPEWINTYLLTSLQLDRQPHSMIFVEDRGTFRCVSANPSETFLNTLLRVAFPQFPANRIRFEPAYFERLPFDKITYTGDVVVRRRLVFPDGIGEVANLLQSECHLPVELVAGSDMMETLHVRGRLDTASFKEKKLPILLAEQPSRGPTRWRGRPSELISYISQHLGLPYLFEVDVIGDEPLDWQLTLPPYESSGSENRAEIDKRRSATIRQFAPSVLREQMGLEVDIHTVSLPSLTVRPKAR